MPEVKRITVTINGVTKTVAKMTITQNGKTKEAAFSYKINFDTNITTSGSQYYVSGQTVSVITPNSRFVAPGDALGTLPTIGNTTYTLSRVSYTIKVVGWYKEKACTNAISASTIPTGNTTYYAKWQMTSSTYVFNESTSTDSVSFSIPKFASSAYWECTTNSQGRPAITKSTYNYAQSAVAVVAPITEPSSSTSKSYNQVAGLSVTVGQHFCTVNGVTDRVYPPSNAEYASGTANLAQGSAAAVKNTFINTNNISCVAERPSLTPSRLTVDWTIKIYYKSTLVHSAILGTIKYNSSYQYESVQYGYYTRSGTWNYVGATVLGEYIYSYVPSTTSPATVSISEVVGTGYKRTFRIDP